MPARASTPNEKNRQRIALARQCMSRVARARRSNGRKSLNLANDNSGAVLLETAIALPVLILFLVGMMQFGLVFLNYLRLTEATGSGARLLSVQRGLDTPWTDTVSEIKAGAPKPAANVSIVLSVNGTACANDGACSDLLRDAQGQPFQVQTSYACNLSFLSSLPQLCPLTSTMIGRVQ